MENKISNLLTREQNEQVFKLFGMKCRSLATAVVQLFLTQTPDHAHWIKKDTGVLCFIKDYVRRNYFFQLYCLNRSKMIWEQELYKNFEYKTPQDSFHTIEIDDCIAGISFASEDDALSMKTVVHDKLANKRQKREGVTQSNRNRKKRHLTKDDIGSPENFIHISHVGWDPHKGFDINVNDPQLKQFFSKAGVSDRLLRDKDTRDFIYDFINTHGGLDTVKSEECYLNSPDVACQNSPPPPPPRNEGQKPPNPTPRNIPSQKLDPIQNGEKFPVPKPRRTINNVSIPHSTPPSTSLPSLPSGSNQLHVKAASDPSCIRDDSILEVQCNQGPSSSPSCEENSLAEGLSNALVVRACLIPSDSESDSGNSTDDKDEWEQDD